MCQTADKLMRCRVEVDMPELERVGWTVLRTEVPQLVLRAGNEP